MAMLVTLGAPLAAQEPDAPSAAPVAPGGTARLLVADRHVGGVGFVLRGDGPRFSLQPLAQALGAELRVGPLGDSHTLMFDERTFLFGPDERTVVTTAPGGEAGDERMRLSAPPIRDAAGLKVPLELLQRTFGDELGYEVEWNATGLELRFSRRELRTLEGTVSLLHQYRISTLEIAFSGEPRFRFEQMPGAVEIRLVGDRFDLVEPFSRPADPLVNDVVVSPTGIRIDLAPDAAAAEPRLLRGDVTRMVIDVYRQQRRGPEDRPEVDRPAVEALAGGVRTIVLDPGHGGSETGATGPGGSVESHLTLLTARMLKTRLERRMAVRVVLTRNEDVDLPLDSRVAIANQNKADLFISLHFNSYRGTKARGAETYFLSREASDQLAAELAEKENSFPSASGMEERADLELILWDLAQSYHLAESQRFASIVQEELNLTLGLRNRGVRQAPFKVLMGANMPAVLVELGFLSNPEEEAKIQNPTYLGELSDSLVRAIRRFKTQVEARQADRGGASSSTEAPSSTEGGP